MKISSKQTVSNSSQIQDIDSIMCGYYRCYYIIERYNGRKPIDIILNFKQQPKIFKELFIRDFANNVFY